MAIWPSPHAEALYSRKAMGAWENLGRAQAQLHPPGRTARGRAARWLHGGTALPHSPARGRPAWRPARGCLSCPFRIQDFESIYQKDVCLEHTKCSENLALCSGFPWGVVAGSPEDGPEWRRTLVTTWNVVIGWPAELPPFPWGHFCSLVMRLCPLPGLCLKSGSCF